MYDWASAPAGFALTSDTGFQYYLKLYWAYNYALFSS